MADEAPQQPYNWRDEAGLPDIPITQGL